MPRLKAPFDKYDYYHRSVQAPEEDVKFFESTFKESFPKHKPTTLREDFCGTYALSCEWAKLRKHHLSVGVDLDPEPIAYGTEHNLSKLNKEQKSRISILQDNVLSRKLPSADIIVAVNFSFFIFKERKMLLEYFQNCYRTLKNPGMMIIDCFGGPSTIGVNEDRTDHDEFVYYWDQSTFNPVTHDSLFYIHYRPKGGKKIEKVFTYDWRLWTVPELKDILLDAGFKAVHIYWEGTTRSGEGDGIFKRTLKGDDAESWVAYLAAEK